MPPGKAGDRERRASRQQRAMALRLGGASFRQIGQALGVSQMQAYRDVQESLRAVVALRDSQVEEFRELELARLDGLLVALAAGVRTGSVDAINGARRISESRRRLLGLDAPDVAAVGLAVASPSETLADLSVEQLAAKMANAARVLSEAKLTVTAPPMALAEPVDAEPTPEALYQRALAARESRNGHGHDED